MYRIIGADGREYGPVNADQIKQWISEGRADARTRAKAKGGAGWGPLETIPEFAGSLGITPSPPPLVEPVAPTRAGTSLGPDCRIGIGSCISRGWSLVMRNFWLLAGVSFVAWVIAAAGFIPFLGFLISLIVGGPLFGGVFMLFLKKVRGRPAVFGDMFAGFGPSFGSLLAASLVSMILIMLGFLLIIPGIYLMVAWTFALPLIIDRRMDFWEAMELSRKMVTQHWWKMFGLCIVFMLLSLAGMLVFFVGFFVATAICQAALAYAYQDIFYSQKEPAVVIP